MKKEKIVYTYILKDIELDIYKIGKTTDPSQRFSTLCTKGEVFPIAIFEKDVEKRLHKVFDDNRIGTNAKAKSGGTEWFRKGGKIFNSFIEDMDDSEEIPYLSPFFVLNEMEKIENFKIVDPSTTWEFESVDYGRYKIAILFLKLIGVLKNVSYPLEISDNYINNGVKLYNNKVLITEKLVDILSKTYKIYLSGEYSLSNIKRLKGDGTITLVSTKLDSNATFYLLINKVL